MIRTWCWRTRRACRCWRRSWGRPPHRRGWRAPRLSWRSRSGAWRRSPAGSWSCRSCGSQSFPSPSPSLALDLLSTFSLSSLAGQKSMEIWLWPSKTSTAGSPRQAKEGNKEEEIWWELSKKKAQKQQVSQGRKRGENKTPFLFS